MADQEKISIGARAVRGSAQSIAASAVTLALGAVRAVLMARLLLPEDFGLAALALFFVNLALQFSGFGFHSAFLHRQEGHETVRRTYFTLNAVLTGAALLILSLSAPILGRAYPGYPGLALVIWAFAGLHLVRTVNMPLTTILSKRLSFGRLAVLDMVGAVVPTLVGPFLAWSGWGVWALVGEFLSAVLARSLVLLLVYRPWFPAFGWDRAEAGYFWNYGKQMWLGSSLVFALDQFDDFWIGTAIGQAPLGFYHKAYEFARYPRRAVSNPVLAVLAPTFARLQDDRQRLSRAFFRTSSLIIRVGVLFSLLFILTAPEFIRLILGEQWVPMQLAFQLMIIYTLLDPLTQAASSLLAAAGYPAAIVRARAVQVAVFFPAVVIGASMAGIEGVALAADLMVVIGTWFIFREARKVVDFSARTLWFWPAVGTASIALSFWWLQPFWVQLPLWHAFWIKGLAITLGYAGFLWAVERRELQSGFSMIWKLLQPRS